MEERARQASNHVLVARGLTKVYGETTVLDDVDLEVGAGEVRALLGENGAGKSTLIKIVSGSVRSNGGTIEVAGRPLVDPTPRSAAEAGVATLHQELAIAPGLSVAENVFLGRSPASVAGVVRRRRLVEMAAGIFDELGFDVDPKLDAGLASPIEKTMTSLARALSQEAPVLILDEPTASLTDSEVQQLFGAINRMRERGTGVVYVSHRLEEVFEIADTFTVLRDGRKVTDGAIAEVGIDDVITAMAGRKIDEVFPRRGTAGEEVVLAAKNVTSLGVKNASVEVRRGEILGIAGLAGAGRSELVRSIGGAQRLRGGEMTLLGGPYRPASPRAAQRAGVVLVPEERRHEGLIPDSVARNLGTTTIDRHVHVRGLVSPAKERAHARAEWERYGIRGRDLDQDVLRLSGGNQQKVVLSKFLTLDPTLILLDEPTRGVDVSTKADIYRLVAAHAEAGAAVVIVSSELPELLGVCHRITVMHEGRLSASFDAATTSEEQLLAVCYGQEAG